MESEERIKIIKLAGKRNVSIPERLNSEKSRVYVSPRSFNRVLTRPVFRLFISGVEQVTGAEYIDEAEDSEAKGLLDVVGNHMTDLDPIARRMGLEHIGRIDFADRLLYYTGYKMEERWYIRMFMGVEHNVYGPTPQDFENYEGALAFYQRSDLSIQEKREKRAIMMYGANLKNGKEAAHDETGSLTRGEKAFVYATYPEGGRSYSQKLKRAPAVVAASFGRRGYFLPIVTMRGPEKALVPQRRPKPWLRDKVVMVIGKPFPKQEMWDWRMEGKKRGEDRNPTDYLMAKIAALLPDEYIEPHLIPLYREIAAPNGW